MTLPDSIYAYLSGIAALTAIVGEHIYHLETVDLSPYPGVWFEVIGDTRPQPFRMAPTTSESRVSFECWADDSATAEAVGALVYDAFMNPASDGLRFTGQLGGGVMVDAVHFESSRALYDEQLQKFGREIDLTIVYQL